MRRLGLSIALIGAGAALLVSAQFAGASTERYGGILRVGTTGASVQVDPQVAYISTAWWLEYATAAKLYNWSLQAKLVPEVASGFTVSNSGRTTRSGSARASVSATASRSLQPTSPTRSTGP